MVAKKLSTYVNETDKNGDKIGTWAEDGPDSKARCKLCMGTQINFLTGKIAFMQHSETKKHRDNLRKVDLVSKQARIDDCLKQTGVTTEKEEILKRKIQAFEIDLVRRLDSHNVPPVITECLVDCIKSHAGGEGGGEVVDGLKLGRTKAEYLAKHGIAKTYFEETVGKLKHCDGFSIGFDESEMNKNHECEVMVMVSDKDTGIELRHYITLSLEGTDADTITRSLTDQMDDDKVPWREKLIATMTDGCNVMEGCRTGVKKRLEQVVPQLKTLELATIIILVMLHNMAVKL